MTPLYASYYTPDYAECAEKLRASLDSFALEHNVEPMVDRGRWDLNCGQKATFLMRVMEQNAGRAVVWVDADAVVHQRPTLFDNLADDRKMDVGVCRWKRLNSHRSAEVLSGTVYLGATPGARQLLEAWAYECRAYPMRWDQVSLSVALFRCNLNVEWLPIEYVFIRDIHRWEYPDARPVIVHHQHSRIRKAREIAAGGGI